MPSSKKPATKSPIYIKDKRGKFKGSISQPVEVPTSQDLPLPQRPAHPDDSEQFRTPPRLDGAYDHAYRAYLAAATGSPAAKLPRPSKTHIIRQGDGSLATISRPLGATVVLDENRTLNNTKKPSILHPNGTSEWWKDGALHRAGDKPAIEHADGTQEWYHNGRRHRAGGKPAVIYPDGRMEWFTNGRQVAYQEPGGQKMDIHPTADKPSTKAPARPSLGPSMPLYTPPEQPNKRDARTNLYFALQGFLRFLRGLERLLK